MVFSNKSSEQAFLVSGDKRCVLKAMMKLPSANAVSNFRCYGKFCRGARRRKRLECKCTSAFTCSAGPGGSIKCPLPVHPCLPLCLNSCTPRGGAEPDATRGQCQCQCQCASEASELVRPLLLADNVLLLLKPVPAANQKLASRAETETGPSALWRLSRLLSAFHPSVERLGPWVNPTF